MSAPAGARLDAERADGALVLHARYAAESEGDLRYTLETTRAGRSAAASRQSGRFAARAGETTMLSTVRIAPGDGVTAVLTVSDGAAVVGTARFSSTSAP